MKDDEECCEDPISQDRLSTAPTNPKWFQKFIYNGNNIINLINKVMDVAES